MYNILTYKHVTEQFNPDHIAPTVSRNKTESSPIKIISKPKSATLAKSQHTLYNQCIVLLNKVSKQQIETRAKTANPALLLSKNVTRLSRSKIDHLQSKPTSAKPHYSKTNSIVINRKIQENSTPTSTTIRKYKILYTYPTKRYSYIYRTTSSKLQITESKQNTASNARRPYTTGATRTIPRPLKRSR
jgi:hypothetical protein